MPRVSTQKVFDWMMGSVGARTKTDLARALGITSPAVHIALKKKRLPPRWIEIIAQKTGKRPSWLPRPTEETAMVRRRGPAPRAVQTRRGLPGRPMALTNGRSVMVKQALEELSGGLRQIAQAVQRLSVAVGR
jgi:hypothetical protein